jgi:P4 family phage/plasmid primase-like protien
MTKGEMVLNYNKQGYRTLEIPSDSSNPKALTRKNWTTDFTNIDIGKNNLYAVVQEKNKLTIDIDDIKLNYILDSYLDKTLIVKTGNGGIHCYFKDIHRMNPMRSCKLYKGGKVIGDIKAGMSYVIGCGSSYQENGITKKYSQISTTDKIMDVDCTSILQILKDNGISTKQEIPTNSTKIKFTDGAQTGERNNQCFIMACNFFEKEENFEAGLEFIKTWNNSCNKISLSDLEVETTVTSAWKRITNKPIDFEGKDRITNVAKELQKNYKFVTLRKTDEILLWTGKIYDNLQAETVIKEETEKLITNCTEHDRREVISKIKAQTYVDLENFDSDPNLITLENGILSIDTRIMETPNPEHLSRILFPVKYHEPEFEINDDTIFADIEKNLENTLFWKSLKTCFTIDGKFIQDDFETVLEIIASVFVKKHIDSKAFMFLGNGENGKSVYLGYIESLIGKNNVSRIPLQEISSDRFASAELDGKSANIFTDLERNELRDTGKIKAITDGEGLQVQKKHGHPFTLYPFVKLMFSCNKFPKVFDQSQGFFRRWKIVRWSRNFENDPERIKYLREKLADNQQEKNLVFSCLIRIANKLNKTGKFTHSQSWKQIQVEWNANADPIDDFDANYIIDSDNHKSKIETHRFYKEIAISKQEVPLGMGQFSKAFGNYHEEDRIINKSTGRLERVWLNIDFKRPKQITLKEMDDTKP